MVEELKELTLQEQVLILLNRRNMTYDMLIPVINANLPNGTTPVKTRSEVSRALSHGYSKGNLGKKNNAIIDGVKSALGI